MFRGIFLRFFRRKKEKTCKVFFFSYNGKYIVIKTQGGCMKNANTGRLGFTLIELLVVVLIVGILAVVALPQYQRAVAKTKAMQGLIIFKSLAQAQDIYYLANGKYAENIEDLDVDVPINLPEWSFWLVGGTGYGSYIDARYWKLVNNQKYIGRFDFFKLNRMSSIYCQTGDNDIYEVCKQLSGGKIGNPPGYGGTFYIIE